MRIERRKWLLTTASTLGFGLSGATAAVTLVLTPSQSTGPYYPRELPLDTDNDLVQVEHAAGTASGQITNLVGQVMDQQGKPVPGAGIEIWQCNAYGRYHHPGDDRARLDPYFQGYGSTSTDPTGRYRFRTIKPVGYPGRAPHIHFAVRPREGAKLITQLYVAGNPANQHDVVLRRIKLPEARAGVMVRFEPDKKDPSMLIARFDIVIPGTVS